jgi:hypothetical protein
MLLATLNTIVDIEASAETVLMGGTVDLTICETNDSDVPLTDIEVDVSANGASIATLTVGSLAAGVTECWDILDVVIDECTEFVATGSGWFGDRQVTFPDYPDEQDTVEVCPASTSVSIEASAETVLTGGTVGLEICETNDGDVDLTNVYVDVYDNIGYWDTVYFGDLAAGETACATIGSDYIDECFTFEAYGYGETADGLIVSYPDDPEEMDTDEVCPASTIVSIEASAETVLMGGTVDLEICETNDGDVDLQDVEVEVYANVVYLDTV